MPIIPFKDKKPKVTDSLFLAPDAWITGDVTVGENCTILFGAVLRGDIQPIRIGSGSNIQDHAMLHSSNGLQDCIVGEHVTVGHHAILHGCTVSSHCIIGMGSTILDGAVIGEYSIVGANSLVSMNKKFPPRSLILGSPAKVVRELTEADIELIKDSARHYVETGRTYLEYFLNA